MVIGAVQKREEGGGRRKGRKKKAVAQNSNTHDNGAHVWLLFWLANKRVLLEHGWCIEVEW